MDKITKFLGILLSFLILSLTGMLTNNAATSVGETISINQVTQASLKLANYLDEWRFLPEFIDLNGRNVSMSSFLWVASRAVLRIYDGAAASDSLPFPPAIPNSKEMYAPLNLSEAAFGEVLKMEEYLSIVNDVASYDALDELEVLDTPHGKLRFVDVVYLIASILRFYRLFQFLPSAIEIPVISVQNLLPWKTPRELGNFTSALDNTYASTGAEFEDWYQIRFYAAAATDYEVFKFALNIIGDTQDPYEAAKRIYDFVKRENWVYSISFSGCTDPSGTDDWLKIPYHTSAIPAFKFSSLFKALGLPVKYRGTYCEVYIPGVGWVEAATHASSFGEPEPEPYRGGSVEPIRRLPSEDDVVIRGIKSVMSDSRALNVSPPLKNSVLVNPLDVESLGVEEVIRRVSEADFDSIFIVVKVSSGYLYYNSSLFPERVKKDILGPLTTAASRRGIKVYAALVGLFDQYTAVMRRDWCSVDWQGTVEYPWISPSIDEYRHYLGQIISEILQMYNVSGILLFGIYFRFLCSGFNPVTIEKFERETGLNISDVADFGKRWISPVFQNWKRKLEDRYVENLTRIAHSIRDDVEVIYATMPIPLGWTPLWTHIYRTDTFSTGYWHAPERIASISRVVDRVMLVYASNYWLNPTEFHLKPPFHNIPEGIYSIYELFKMHLNETVSLVTSARGKLAASIQLTDEWPFSPEFYFSVVKLFKGYGISWVSFRSSGILMDTYPSLSLSEWVTISLIRSRTLASRVLKPGPMVTGDVKPTVLKEGEETTLVVTFVNRGQGEAKSVTARIEALGFIVVSGIDFSPDIPSGGSGSVQFVLRPLEGGRKTLKITITYADVAGNTYKDVIEASLLVLVKLRVEARSKAGTLLDIPMVVGDKEYKVYEDWIDPTAEISLEVPEVVKTDGTRYVFEHWSDGFQEHYRRVMLTKSATLAAIYRIEHYVSVESPYGEVGGSGWYEEGTETTISVEPTAVGFGIKYVFDHWEDEKGNVVSNSPIFILKVERPTSLRAVWRTDYTELASICGVVAVAAIAASLLLFRERIFGKRPAPPSPPPPPPSQ